MTRSHVSIAASSKKYWVAEIAKFMKESQANAADLDNAFAQKMHEEWRGIFTRNRNGELIRDNATSVAVLIEQAMLVLKENQFDEDEIDCLRGLLEKAAPKDRAGTAPIPMIDKISICYFFDRMTGQEPNMQELTVILSAEYLGDAAEQASKLSDALAPLIRDDQKHRLNKFEAHRLLRELFKIEGRNTLGGILNPKPKRK